MREIAVQRYLDGENPESICLRLRRSRSWLYKWLNRYDPEKPDWNINHSKRPNSSPRRTPKEVEEIVKLTRLSLYNNGLFSGAQAILWELEEHEIITKVTVTKGV